MSYRVVLCRTVSYCVVLCRTVSYRVVPCRTVSYGVVAVRHLVRHCTTRRTPPTRRAPTPCTTPRRVVQCISDSTQILGGWVLKFTPLPVDKHIPVLDRCIWACRCTGIKTSEHELDVQGQRNHCSFELESGGGGSSGLCTLASSKTHARALVSVTADMRMVIGRGAVHSACAVPF